MDKVPRDVKISRQLRLVVFHQLFKASEFVDGKSINVVVKGASFRVSLECQDEEGRAIELSKLILDTQLVYDNPLTPMKPVDFVSCPPVQHKPKTRTPTRTVLEMRVNVLSSKHEGSLFRIKIIGKIMGVDEYVIALTDPFKVISKVADRPKKRQLEAEQATQPRPQPQPQPQATLTLSSLSSSSSSSGASSSSTELRLKMLLAQQKEQKRMINRLASLVTTLVQSGGVDPHLMAQLSPVMKELSSSGLLSSSPPTPLGHSSTHQAPKKTLQQTAIHNALQRRISSPPLNNGTSSTVVTVTPPPNPTPNNSPAAAALPGAMLKASWQASGSPVGQRLSVSSSSDSALRFGQSGARKKRGRPRKNAGTDVDATEQFSMSFKLDRSARSPSLGMSMWSGESWSASTDTSNSAELPVLSSSHPSSAAANTMNLSGSSGTSGTTGLARPQQPSFLQAQTAACPAVSWRRSALGDQIDRKAPYVQGSLQQARQFQRPQATSSAPAAAGPSQTELEALFGSLLDSISRVPAESRDGVVESLFRSLNAESGGQQQAASLLVASMQDTTSTPTQRRRSGAMKGVPPSPIDTMRLDSSFGKVLPRHDSSCLDALTTLSTSALTTLAEQSQLSADSVQTPPQSRRKRMDRA